MPTTTNTATHCYHCGESLPPGVSISVPLDGAERAMCCYGCAAVAELVAQTGLTDFYRYRTAPAMKPVTADTEWQVFDRAEARKRFTRANADGSAETDIVLEGINCAACAWLIEHSLAPVPGVLEASVNPATGRARLRWDDAQTGLGSLLTRIAALGYRPHPVAGGMADIHQAERRTALKRLAVAGLGMMQVMMYAVALYAGSFQGMDAHLAQFLRLVSLLVATPVVFYAGKPFFVSAWRDLAHRQTGMDVPVSIAIGSAYLASVWATLSGRGEVYFDSAVMFVFFLSLGRYAEMLARHRAGAVTDALVRMHPATATRLDADGTATTVTVAELESGDVVQVRHGEQVPADGRILRGEGRMDESMLTGEPEPVRRGHDSRVYAASLNQGGPIEVAVERIGGETLVSAIGRLMSRAQAERPPVAQMADRAARWFVAVLLVLAALIGSYWYFAAPEEAFRITLAVLVVTCPCALSLATPAAITAATGALARAGLLVTRGSALEILARTNSVLFDKTGTLTRGRPGIVSVQILREGMSEDRARTIAAALERDSEHPLALAFREHQAQTLSATDIEFHTGRGIEGTVDGTRWRIGTPTFCAEFHGQPIRHDAGVVLADADGKVVRFTLEDPLRAEAQDTVRALADAGLMVAVASGDAPLSVAATCSRLNIGECRARLAPEDKLAWLRDLQATGKHVAVVGDGVNDAPVLAGADVGIAMGSGSALAQTSADVIVLNERLESLPVALATAKKTVRVIRTNLAWAVGYNLIAIPLAASGMLAPWMAAVGMSASSLIVVLNALRAGRPAKMPQRLMAPLHAHEVTG